MSSRKKGEDYSALHLNESVSSRKIDEIVLRRAGRTVVRHSSDRDELEDFLYMLGIAQKLKGEEDD